jgi:hypothetical protein
MKSLQDYHNKDPIQFLFLTLFLLILSSPPATAQEHPSTSKTIAAYAANILVPGLGHAILGNNKKANAYVLTDVLLGCGVLLTGIYSLTPVDEVSKSFAYEHAGAGRNPADDTYWQNVGWYSNTSAYNSEMERIYRGLSHDYLDSMLFWRWDDQTNMAQYRDMRQNESNEHNTKHSVGNVMWGLVATMALNRIISTIDLGLSQRKNARPTTVSVHPESRIGVDRQYIGLVIRF